MNRKAYLFWLGAMLALIPGLVVIRLEWILRSPGTLFITALLFICFFKLWYFWRRSAKADAVYDGGGFFQTLFWLVLGAVICGGLVRAAGQWRVERALERARLAGWQVSQPLNQEEDSSEENASTWLKKAKPRLEDLDRAFKAPRLSWGIRYRGDPMELILPPLSSLQSFANLNLTAGLEALRQGENKKALDRAKKSWWLASLASKTHTLFGAMLDAAAAQKAFELSEKVLNTNQSTALYKNLYPMLARYQGEADFLKNQELEYFWKPAWYGQAPYCQVSGVSGGLGYFFAGESCENLGPLEWALQAVVYSTWLWMGHDAAATLCRNQQLRQCMNALPAEEQACLDSKQSVGRTWTFSAMAAAGDVQAHHQALAADAKARLLLLGMAAKSYRFKTGQWPSALKALKGAKIPEKAFEDPFNKQLMRLAKSEKKLKIYSVGSDFVDGGGNSNEESSSDITLILEP